MHSINSVVDCPILLVMLSSADCNPIVIRSIEKHQHFERPWSLSQIPDCAWFYGFFGSHITAVFMRCLIFFRNQDPRSKMVKQGYTTEREISQKQFQTQGIQFYFSTLYRKLRRSWYFSHDKNEHTMNCHTFKEHYRVELRTKSCWDLWSQNAMQEKLHYYKRGWCQTIFPPKQPETKSGWVGLNLVVTTTSEWPALAVNSCKVYAGSFSVP